ncbi:MFS transporter [Pigmentiphaga soli]|uniref:MFS transporter n=1 Tax=Pigmentiphaga soli TaxID=1007095 RepID=A0ABP8HD36_9BURK
MFGVCAVVMLVALDSTIVGTILPQVARELDGMALYAWVGTGYLLSSAIVIPIFGRLGDLFGRKPFILASIVVVAVGSLMCALSQTMPHLIVARTLQGLGGGMLVATAFAAPADLFPDAARRIRWQALVSTCYAVASGLGPLLGGAVTQAIGWRAAFLVVPAVAVVSFVMLFRYFPRLVPRHERRPRIDWLGGVLLVVAVGAPMAALELGFAVGAKPLLAALFALVGAAAIAALWPYEKRVELPMFPLRVLASRESRLLNVVSVMIGAVMFNLMYYGPLLLQTVVGMTPAQAGLVLAPLVACIPLGSVINGRLFPRQSQPQRLLVLGAAIVGAGCLGVMGLDSGSSTGFAFAVFGLSGVGLGFVLPNLTLFMQIIADRRDVGVASALVQTTRTLGSAVGTAVIGIIITRTSVPAGVHSGIVMSLLFCAVTVVLAPQIKMKNLRR